MGTYPSERVCTRQLADGRRVVIRPIRRDDEPREHQFLDHLSGDTRRRRFMCYTANPDGRSCQFGIVVADDWHHTGIAQLLMAELTRAARRHGLQTMEGLVLRDNADMPGFVSALAPYTTCPRSQAWSGW